MNFSETKHLADDLKLITVNPVDVTDSMIDNYLQGVIDLTKQEKKFVLIIDISKGKFLNAQQRTKIAKSFEIHEKSLKDKIKCIVYVSTPVMGVILKTINAFAKKVLPDKVTTSLDDALAYAKEINK